jgi:AraC-like DNA-binding protein
MNVSEIAFEVGFQSLSQFNRVFKKLSGQSPSRYRAAGCPINRSSDLELGRQQENGSNNARRNA